LHCYNAHGGTYLDSDQFDYILHEIVKYTYSHGFVPGRAIFCGGEPTLSPILLESIRKCTEAGFRSISLLTNGVLMTDDFAGELVRAGCTRVQICIEGNRETHNSIRNGSWDQVHKAWEICRSNGLYVGNQTTINPLNYKQVEEVINVCRGRVDWTAFLKQIPHNDKIGILAPSQWLEVLERIFYGYGRYGAEYRDFVCVRDIQWSCLFYDTGYNSCAYTRGGPYLPIVEANGDVYPCRRGGIPVGNIFEKNLERIYSESEILQRAQVRENLNDKCKACENVDTCGGCRALAQHLKGDILAEDPLCIRDELSTERTREIEENRRKILIPRIHGTEIQPKTSEVLDFMRITGKLESVVEEMKKRRMAEKEAKSRGMKVTTAELQRAADVFRYSHRLTKAKAFRKWLEALEISLEEFEEYLETSLLIEKFKDALEIKARRNSHLKTTGEMKPSESMFTQNGKRGKQSEPVQIKKALQYPRSSLKNIF
jgi:radical SAM protein with 4Fe4S-binding SPASM domain